MGAVITGQLFETLDYHAAGEPLRIVRDGLPDLPAGTMLDKRRYMASRLDQVRRLLMLEPRGHADMYGAVLTEPVSEGSDCGVLFMHNAGYSTMCGHGIIALATAILEHRLLEIEDPACIRIDTPAGRVVASAELEDGAVKSVSFVNVPAFVQEELFLPFNGRKLHAAVIFGGAWYVLVDAAGAGVGLEPGNAAELIAAGRSIRETASGLVTLRHPDGDPDLDFLYGVIFAGPGAKRNHSRNVCIFADGELDRSPTGTGVSGRAAYEFSKERLGIGEPITIESITGGEFTVECVAQTRVGERPAVETRVTGSAFMTGEHRFVLAPGDPLHEGIFIR